MSITNTQAKELIKQIPENDSFLYDLGVFITSNEKGSKKTLAVAQKSKGFGNTALIVSGFFGLDLVAKRNGIQRIIAIDVAPSVEAFWRYTAQIIEGCESRDMFIRNFIISLSAQQEVYFGPIIRSHGDSIKTWKQSAISSVLTKITDDPNFWLNNDKSYAKIRKIFVTKGFIFKRMSLTDDSQVIHLCTALSKVKNIFLDIIYHSNIYHILKTPSQVESFDNNIQRLRSLGREERLVPRVFCKDEMYTQSYESHKAKNETQKNLAVLFLLKALNWKQAGLNYLFPIDFLASHATPTIKFRESHPLKAFPITATPISKAPKRASKS